MGITFVGFAISRPKIKDEDEIMFSSAIDRRSLKLPGASARSEDERRRGLQAAELRGRPVTACSRCLTRAGSPRPLVCTWPVGSSAPSPPLLCLLPCPLLPPVPSLFPGFHVSLSCPFSPLCSSSDPTESSTTAPTFLPTPRLGAQPRTPALLLETPASPARSQLGPWALACRPSPQGSAGKRLHRRGPPSEPTDALCPVPGAV